MSGSNFDAWHDTNWGKFFLAAKSRGEAAVVDKCYLVNIMISTFNLPGVLRRWEPGHEYYNRTSAAEEPAGWADDRPQAYRDHSVGSTLPCGCAASPDPIFPATTRTPISTANHTQMQKQASSPATGVPFLGKIKQIMSKRGFCRI